MVEFLERVTLFGHIKLMPMLLELKTFAFDALNQIREFRVANIGRATCPEMRQCFLTSHLPVGLLRSKLMIQVQQPQDVALWCR